MRSMKPKPNPESDAQTDAEAEAAPKPEDAPPPEYGIVDPPCRHLRSKGMYVYTDGPTDADTHEDYDNTIYWCLKTHKGFGPDNDEVHRDYCCDASRSCHEPL